MARKFGLSGVLLVTWADKEAVHIAQVVKFSPKSPGLEIGADPQSPLSLLINQIYLNNYKKKILKM